MNADSTHTSTLRYLVYPEEAGLGEITSGTATCTIFLTTQTLVLLFGGFWKLQTGKVTFPNHCQFLPAIHLKSDVNLSSTAEMGKNK